MPFKNISDLPEKVSNNLPKHAQRIFLAAFNNAWEQYDQPDERKADTSREVTAHKVAWAAVKTTYQKNKSGKWVTKSK